MSPRLPAAFIRMLHQLPPSDRRNLLGEMDVTGVDPRDEESFYGWLAERYQLGEMPAVDAALRRCCAKAEERTSVHRVIAWLA